MDNRHAAMVSLLAGNGHDWARKNCKLEKGVTLLQAVRAEEKAIDQMRKRIRERTEKARARALAQIEELRAIAK